MGAPTTNTNLADYKARQKQKASAAAIAQAKALKNKTPFEIEVKHRPSKVWLTNAQIAANLSRAMKSNLSLIKYLEQKYNEDNTGEKPKDDTRKEIKNFVKFHKIDLELCREKINRDPERRNEQLRQLKLLVDEFKSNINLLSTTTGIGYYKLRNVKVKK